MPNTIYEVATASELYAALANSTGGETIRMAGGDYGALKLKAAYHDLTYDAPVKIVSADADNPAIISEMNLNGASNITFENITFKSYYTAAANWYEPFIVRDSSDISFKNVLFEGTPAEGISEAEDGTGRGKGLYVASSQDISITDSEFAMWHRGMVFSDVENLTVARNDVHSIRSDGMNFAGVRNTLIEDNHIHDFNAVLSSGDHADMLQFINLGTSPSANIVIRGNTFDIGEGSHLQTLFMTNQIVSQSDAGLESYYQNVLIEENVILNGHAHGITVGETNGLTVRNNTVLSVDPDHPEFSSTPYISVSNVSRDVTIEGNVTQSVIGHTGQADWTVADNVFVQNSDPQKDGFYGDLFITSTFGGPVDDYTVRPDSEIATAGAGAQRLLLGNDETGVEALFDMYSVKDMAQTIRFDAGVTLNAGGDALPDGAKFLWDFGDGTTAEGRVVQHEYTGAGIYDAKLRVVLPDGQSYSEATEVKIAGRDVISLNAAGTAFQQHGFGSTEDITRATLVSETGADGSKTLSIGAGGGVTSIPKEALARYFGSDSFELSLTLRADAPSVSYGEIGRIHDSMMLTTNPAGELELLLALDTGWHGLKTQNARLNDGGLHKIDVIFEDDVSTLKILVDGVEVASRAANGNVEGMKSYGLTLGNAWGKHTFDGQISALELNVDSYDYSVIDTGAGDAQVPVSVSPTPVVEDDQQEPIAPQSVAPAEPEDQPQDDPVVAAPVEEQVNFSDVALGVMAKEELEGLFGSDNFQMSMTLQADNPGNSYGEVARIHDNFMLNVTSDGGLRFIMWHDGGGAVVLSSGGVGLNDGKAHDIAISFDQSAGDLSLLVDDKKVASGEVTGSVKDMQYWDLTFGNSWGKRGFDGDVSEVEIEVLSNDNLVVEKWIIGDPDVAHREKVQTASMLDTLSIGFAQEDSFDLSDPAYRAEVLEAFDLPPETLVGDDLFLS